MWALDRSAGHRKDNGLAQIRGRVTIPAAALLTHRIQQSPLVQMFPQATVTADVELEAGWLFDSILELSALLTTGL